MEKRKVFIALAVCLAGLIEGCATKPPEPPKMAAQTLMLDKEVYPMERQEVIQAIKECESQKLRAVMVYARRKINNQSAVTVVDVTCSPSY